MAGVKNNGLIGYWPEAFVAIIEGTAPESEEQFAKVAKKLITHRLFGQPLNDENLRSPEVQAALIKDLHKVYQLASDKPFEERVPYLLNSLFMQTLIQPKIVEGKEVIDLTDEGIEYVAETSIPEAFRAIGYESRLENQALNNYLLAYGKVRILQKMIQPNLDLRKLLTPEESKNARTTRSQVSGIWYPAYKASQISQNDVWKLWRALQTVETLTPETIGEHYTFSNDVNFEDTNKVHEVVFRAIGAYLNWINSIPERENPSDALRIREVKALCVHSNMTTFYQNTFNMQPDMNQFVLEEV